MFDLVHIDGQQDGDGTYHDLDMAVLQAKYILVDGYHWTRQNFLAINEWLWFNRAALDFSINIPGYAGDMLIRTKLHATSIVKDDKTDSKSLVQALSMGLLVKNCKHRWVVLLYTLLLISGITCTSIRKNSGQLLMLDFGCHVLDVLGTSG